MEEYLKAVKVTDKVYWVGAIDWSVRNFHGYRTNRGSTYNAFLVLDDKITLIDSVKAPFVGELLARIRSVIGDVSKIDYFVSNHSEPDHSGGIPETLAAIKPEKAFVSPVGKKTLTAYYGELGFTEIKTGESIELGKSRLTCVETKMVHWPDSMVTYLDTEKILFSQDAFGMHLAGSKLFADEYDPSVLDYEARKYYANILNHLSPKIASLLDALPGWNLDIGMIAPDHGPLWRRPEDIAKILKLYRECTLQEPKPRAAVVFSTMWHSTERLAKALVDGIRSTGVEVQEMDLQVTDRSEVITEITNCGLMAFGAPTLNNQMYPAMADVLCYVKGLRPRNKIGFAFGSYGWSGEGAKQIAADLTAMNAEQPVELFQVKYMPSAEDLKRMSEIGEKLGRLLLERVGK